MSLLVAVTVAGWLAIEERNERTEALAELETQVGVVEAGRDSVASTLDSIDAASVQTRAELLTESDLGAEMAETVALMEQSRDELLATVALAADQRDTAATERDQVVAALGDSVAAYGAAQLEILAGLSRLDIQADQVFGLSVCLEGVTRALNAYSVDDGSTAEAELAEVVPACDYAVASIIEGLPS